MCMIAYRPSNAGNIPNAVIDTAIGRHSDGFGVAYRVKGKDGAVRLVAEKFGPAERKAFRRALKRVDRTGSEYVAHFRFATHGAKDAEHAHPYEYEDPDPAVGTVLVFHNGIIDIRTKDAESDTQVFVRDVLTQLPSQWWTNGALRYLVTEAIGWSKLTIMTAEKTINLHDSRGEWDGGIWYSSSHKSSAAQYGHWDNATQEWIMPNGKPAVRSASTWVSGYAAPDGTWVPGYDKSKAGTSTTVTGKGQTGVRPITSIVPYASSAARSAAALGLMDTSEVGAGVDSDGWTRFRHGGHNLTSIRNVDLTTDGDWEDSVICDECQTTGTVYVIEGTSYIDMAHLTPDDSEDLLPQSGYAFGAWG